MAQRLCTACEHSILEIRQAWVRTCSGSMILLEVLQANAKRVVEEYNSISLRRAC